MWAQFLIYSILFTIMYTKLNFPSKSIILLKFIKCNISLKNLVIYKFKLTVRDKRILFIIF